MNRVSAMVLKKVIRSALGLLDLEVHRKIEKSGTPFPVELSRDEKELFGYVRRNGLTMVSDERLFATILACKYVVEHGIDGAFVECGVWRGGNALLAAGVFKLYGAARKVYLFDTFAGMTLPTEYDTVAMTGEAAHTLNPSRQGESHNEWCYASLEEVKGTFEQANLLDSNIIFVKGDVLSTLSVADHLPETIAVLRLDTDWYESTKMELETLYPRLSIGGVIMIDDYGYWTGARRATDEYFACGQRPFLQYTDATGRAGVKVTRDA
jgi:O-methyltransferase